ncbi:MAG: 7-cyano-7-deazaguanine synthase, partial [Halobaculum sp.]
MTDAPRPGTSPTDDTQSTDDSHTTDDPRTTDGPVSTDGPSDRGGDSERRAVVLASGGMDSATAAYVARDRGYEELYLLHTSYGQQTETREYECARALADHVDAADFLHVETDHLATIGGSSLTDDDRAVADADLDSAEIPDSYVPFRNANLLSMAVSYAEASGCSAVFIGAHSEDFSGYPDCRPAFF